MKSVSDYIYFSSMKIANEFETLHLSATRSINHNEMQRDIKLSTYGILFMGTPHRGGEGVPWAKLALNIVNVAQYTNSEILGHLEENSELLENQQTLFLPISRDFDTTYFYEEYPTMVAGRPVIVCFPMALISVIFSRSSSADISGCTKIFCLSRVTKLTCTGY